MPKKRKQLRGTVEKIIKSNDSPVKAQIAIHEGEDLYREIRLENELTDGDGAKASLKQGAEVDVIVEADPDATVTKPTTSDKSNAENSRDQSIKRIDLSHTFRLRGGAMRLYTDGHLGCRFAFSCCSLSSNRRLISSTSTRSLLESCSTAARAQS